MNQQAYRVIFNKSRSMLMAVAENVSSHGKAAAGTSSSGSQAVPLLRFATLGLLVAMLFGGVTVVQAQMVAYKNGGSGPTIDRSANGRPLVQIVTPNAAGVSHNRYEQYNVDSNGVILNNARTVTQTQLGGYVEGNPNLANGSARIILNEVMGSGRSLLNGYTEVAGQRAEVIIANPNGITCSGCGFINTTRGVLTTGTPQFGGDGSLEAFRVTRGDVQINGLNANNIDQLDLIARSVQVNGQLWANRLNAVTGSNQVNYADLGVTVIQGEGARPTVGIDVAQLGGMYANKIRLIGTEFGVGVRSLGTISAQDGDLHLDSRGKITLNGKTNASGSVAIRSDDDIGNSGTLYGQQTVQISSSGQIANSGTLAAQSNLNLTAASVQSSGVLAAGIDADGKATQAGNLNLNASGSIAATGQNTAGGNLSMTAASIDLANAATSSAGSTTLTASAGDINHAGANLQAAGAATFNAAGAVINDGGIIRTAQLASTSGSLSNVGGNITQSGSGDTHITTRGTLDNSGGTLAANAHNLHLQSGSLSNDGGHITHAGTGVLNIDTGAMRNIRGEVVSNGALVLNAANLTNQQGSVRAATTLDLQAVALNNAQGVLDAARINASVAQLNNNAGKINADQLNIHAANLSNQQGQILQFGKDTSVIDVSDTLDNSNGGLIQTNSTDLTLTPQHLNNAGGTISHAGTGQLNINLGSGALHNQGGTIGSNGSATVTAANIDNRSGSLFGAGRTTITATSGDIDNSNKGYLAGDSLTLKAAGQVNNAAGKIEAIKNGVAIQARSLNNAAGTVQNIGASALDIRLKQGLSNTAANGVGGFIGSAGSINVSASDIDNTNGTFYSKQDLTLSADGALTNDAGVIQSDGSLSATASAAVSNQAGRIEANGSAATLAISGSSIDNTSGRIANSGTGATTLQGGTSIVNDAGTIGGNGDVTLAASRLSNTRQGQIIAGGNLNLAIASEINNRQGKLFAARNLSTQQAGATLNNTQGNIGASGNIALSLASLDNSGGQIGNTTGDGGGIALSSSGNLANAGGNIGSDKNLSINANTITGNGKVIAGQDLTLNLQGDYTNSTGNLLSANRDFNFSSSGTLTNAGNLEAVRNLSLTAANFNNQYGALVNAGNGSTVIKASNAFYNLGRIYGDDVAIGAQSVTNDGVLNADGSTKQAGVIAARNNLNIGASSIVNREHAILQSLGDMALGGALDANNKVTGSAASILNSSATIDAGNNLLLQTAKLENTNAHFATKVEVDPRLTKRIKKYRFENDPRIYDESEVDETNTGHFTVMVIKTNGARFERFTVITWLETTRRTVVTQSDPASILAGGNMTLSGAVVNDKSKIIAGGAIGGNLDSLTNTPAEGETIVHHGGDGLGSYSQFHGTRKCGTKRCDDWRSKVAIDEDLPATSFDLNISAYQQNTRPTHGNNDAVGTGVDGSTVPNSGSSSIGGNQGGRDVSGKGQSVDAAAGSAGGVQTVGVPGTPIPNLVLPNSQLFVITQNPGLGYLIETDPKFTNYRQFISSDYLLGRLAFDPQKVQKRLGDGFYEQKLINDQIAELTGRRFLGSYSSNEEQYKALMEAGVASAQQFQLTPGIALTAAQMAALTSDIVWLVSQDVKLPDGSTTSVLVPVVYLARVDASDVRPTGSLISGRDIDLSINGSLQNGGTLQASNNTLIHATDIGNTGNIRSNAQTGKTILVADNDLINNGGKISGNRVGILAGRDVVLSTTTSSSGVTAASNNLGFSSDHTAINKIASINADQLSIQSGRDINLNAASINTTGDAALVAGRDLNMNAITTKDAVNYNYDEQNHLRQSQTVVNGTGIQSGGSLALAAGQDINATAAYANAGGNLTAAAGRDINLSTAQQESHFDQETKSSSSGILSSSSIHTRDIRNSSEAVGTTFSGDSVQMIANRDINVTDGNVVGTHDVALVAGNNVNLLAAQNTYEQSYSKEEKKSGMFSSGGVGFTVGKQEQQNAQTSKQLIHSDSTVGSTDGNIVISAGNAYTQTGSNVLAPKGDIGIVAKSVDINAAIDTMSATQDSKFKQTGVTVAVTNPVISAVQTAQQMNRASSQTSDGRMQVLAGAVTALSGYNAYNDVAADKTGTAGGVGISISLGSSKSESHSRQSSTTAQGSTVAAGGNLNIIATGGGKDSNINVIGSNISAGNNAKLIADNNINLQAAQSTYEQHSTNSSSSGSIGVGYSTTSGFTVNASASMGRGKADGSDVSYSNTHVNAGNQLVIASGGDLNMKGATASAEQVIAAVGGNLNIESLQDTSTYNSTQKNIGVGVTIPIGAGAGGVNISGGKSKIDSNFQSVGEQSGIKAGDGGFDVYVKGNTDLKGGVIASTDKAVQDAKNSFVTGSLTQSDIQNEAHYDAKSVSITTGVGTQPAGSQGTGVGFGTDSGNASSTSQSGISGIAGNTDVRTGDQETGIGKIFDQAKVQKDIDAQTQITLAFSQQAPKAVATFAGGRAEDLRKQADQEPDLDKRAELMADAGKWDEGGVYRVALHTATGALSGGVAGALGAGAAAGAAPLLTDLQNNVRDGLINAGVDPTTATLTSQAIALGTAAGMGALVSGGSTAGAGMGLAIDANNRQLHPDERTLAKQLAANSNGKYTVEQVEDALRAAGNKRSGEGVGTGSIVNVDGNKATVYDDGAKWSVVQNGQNGTQQLIQQVPLNVSPDLMAYIQQGTGNNYTWSPTQNLSLNMNNASGILNPYKQANCIGTQCSVVTLNPQLPTRNQMADGAGWLSTQSGQFAAAATAYGTFLANSPNPILQAGAATQLSMAWTATLAGFGASALEQLLRPNVGQTLYEGALGLGGQIVSDRIPLASPVVNELGQTIKGTSSPFVTDWINQKWDSINKSNNPTGTKK